MEHPHRVYIVSLLRTFCKKHQVGLQRGERGTDGESERGGGERQNQRKGCEFRPNLGLNYLLQLFTVLQT